MKKIIITITSIIVLIIILFFVSKNSIVTNTKNLLNTNINSIYNYINKYNYGNEGIVNVTANYKGVHGSTNPINFEYKFITEFKDSSLYTTIENNDGYYSNEINNNLINLYMRLKNNDNVKDLFNIKDIKEEFNKIIFTFDESIINKLLNTNCKSFKLIVNTNILYLGVRNYKLLIDDNEYLISSDFKTIDGKNIRININNNGYNINYNDNIKINYKEKDGIDIYNLSIDDLIISAELSNTIFIKAVKEVNIYNGLDIKVDFKDVDITKTNEIARADIPIYRYFDNVNTKIGGLYE